MNTNILRKSVCGGVGNSYLWHPKLLQGDELNVKGRLLRRGWEPYLACPPYLTSSHGLISSFLIEKTLCSKKVCLSHFEITILWFPFRHMLRGDRGALLDRSLFTASNVVSRHNPCGGKIAVNCPGFSGKGLNLSLLMCFFGTSMT